MQPQEDEEGHFDVFGWNRSHFSGQVKATWETPFGYHSCPANRQTEFAPPTADSLPSNIAAQSAM
jgi:hypothetical protein